MSARDPRALPAPDVRELPDDEAWRAMFDTFGVLDSAPTEPMPLELEVIEGEAFLVRALRVLGVRK